MAKDMICGVRVCGSVACDGKIRSSSVTVAVCPCEWGQQ